MPLTDELIAAIMRHENGAGFLILGASAAIEYLFPPFPGDAITVFGAFLVTRRGWPLVPVMLAVLAGSMVGFMIDYGAGRLLARSEERWTGRLARVRPRLDALVERFRRHGALYLVINRFLPSVRAFFFLAAGLARLPAWKVLVFGGASALLWNALLFVLGATVGSEWERLRSIVHTYALAASGALAVAVGALAIGWWWRRRRTRA